MISYAQGGLANAWGAGVYEFDDKDLSGFPFKSSELRKYYDVLKREIGVSGRKDDLSEYFGETSNLQEPPPLNWA